MKKIEQLQSTFLSAAADCSIIKCCDTEFTKDIREKHITLLAENVKRIIELSGEIADFNIITIKK